MFVFGKDSIVQLDVIPVETSSELKMELAIKHKQPKTSSNPFNSDQRKKLNSMYAPVKLKEYILGKEVRINDGGHVEESVAHAEQDAFHHSSSAQARLRSNGSGWGRRSGERAVEEEVYFFQLQMLMMCATRIEKSRMGG